jgi:Mrp family chromosome partitioning ATPase
MDSRAITADQVHQALRAVRRGEPLDDSPLLRLDVLRLRLRTAGRADSPEGRVTELANYLDEIDREAEISQLRRLLTRHRLVALTGVGGVGKSRLAMELGRAVAGEYAASAWLVGPSAVWHEAHVVSALAAEFRMR